MTDPSLDMLKLIPHNQDFNLTKENVEQQSFECLHKCDEGNTILQNYYRIDWKIDLPKFNKNIVDMWFILVDSEFSISKTIDDDVKFNSVIKALDSDSLERILDAIREAPSQNKYAFIKNIILKRFGKSDADNLRRLFKDTHLGTKKPSELLHEMKNLASNNMTNLAIQVLWMEELPPELPPFLELFNDLTLDKLAEKADSLIFWFTKSNSEQPVSSTNAVDEVLALHGKVENMEKTLCNVLQEIKELRKEEIRKVYHSRSRSRRRSTSKDYFQFSTCEDICYYHRKFGTNARNCSVPPCSFDLRNKQNRNYHH